jgi:hypothetical protein
MQKSRKGVWSRLLVLGLAVLSIGMLWSVPAHAQTGPGTMCVLQISADGGEVMSMLTNSITDFTIVVSVPASNTVNVPVRCTDVGVMALAVANQSPGNTTVEATVLNNKGQVQCSRGPYTLVGNGARGIIFNGCI